MKKNIAPLLAIAFVVAAISTGVFYGLFAGRLGATSPDLQSHTLVIAARDLDRGTVLKREDLRVAEVRLKAPLKGAFDSPDKLVGATVLDPVEENAPIIASAVASNDANTGGVPQGMRALSIHVYESTGVMALLRRGSKVDIQAVSERNGTFALSTVLQNVEVLSILPADPAAGKQAAPIVTVLARPTDSDVVALADSGTHLRVALRNPLDNQTEPRKSVTVPDLYRPESPKRQASNTGSGDRLSASSAGAPAASGGR